MVVFVLERMQLYFLVRIRGLRQLLDGKGWLWNRLHPDLVGRAILCKSLIKFSVDGAAVLTLLLTGLWLPSPGVCRFYSKVKGDSKGVMPSWTSHYCLLLPMLLTLQQATSVTHASTEDHQTLIDKSDSVFCGSPLLLPLCPGLHKVLFVPS